MPAPLPAALAEERAVPQVRARPIPPAAAVQRAPLKLARLSERDQGALGPTRAVGVVGQPTPRGLAAQASASTLAGPTPIAAHLAAVAPSASVAQRTPAKPPLAGPISRKPADADRGRGRGGGEPTAPISAPSRLTLGQSRKLGLGAPITAAPVTAAPLSGPDRASPLPLPARAEVQRKPADSAPASAATATPTPTPEPTSAARRTATRFVGAAGTGAAARLPSAPLLSASPLRTRVQRAQMTATRARPSRDSAEAEGRSASVGGGPVKVHRGTLASELAESLDAKAFTHQGEIYLPSSAGPMGSVAARSLIAHEMTHVAQQRAYGSRLPQEHTSHGQELERTAAAAEHHPELPLAQPPARPTQTEESRPDDMAAAQRKPADGARASSSVVETTTVNFPGVQRAREDKGAEKPRSSGTATDSSGKKSETELEELAGQLYGRISRRLRRELLVDRERAGLMVDLP
ncbi:MAG: eCIS core domain-containing protein [Candidatus Limnocylindrales bacterium]